MKMNLDKLESIEGSGTSLITLMIPADGNLNKAKQKLAGEYSTSKQIKSRV